MPVRRGTPIDPDATKARVLATAARLFYERGVHRVGVDEIAEQAGASKLSLYRYFGSKDGLIEAVLRDRSDRIHRWLAEGTADTAPGRERLLALFDRLVRWFGQEGYHGCAVVNTATEARGGPPVVREIARGHLHRYRDLLAGNLRAAGAPEALAGQLLLLIEGATVVTGIDGTPDAGREARAAAETLIDASLN